ncbi:MAG: N-acetylmuramoyl-L-alanine amidase [Pseudomonadota bacterium]
MIRAAFIFVLAILPASIMAQDFRALARIEPTESHVRDQGSGVEIDLGLSQAVPYRVRLFDDPPRLTVDFREVSWSGLPQDFDGADRVLAVHTGAARDTAGWSRLVLALDGPYLVDRAGMQTDPETGAAQVTIRLEPTNPASFAVIAEPAPARRILADPLSDTPGPIIVALDPGHGGVDPGAEAGDVRESDLMLGFALELAERLRRTGLIDVVMTRQSDVFVSLPQRITIARAAQADIFISLHADALSEGRAAGATVYTLADTAVDAATASLTERFDRDDMIQGTDLAQADDVVAAVLMDLNRQSTVARSGAAADAIVAAFEASGVALHRQPRLHAGFTVLTAADIPSLLVEIGFLSDPDDLARIQDPEARAIMQNAMAEAILAWAEADAAAAPLRLQ